MRAAEETLPLRHAADYCVRFDESTPASLVRSSALLGYVVDTAWRHSEVLGFPRSWYRERGVFWLVRAVEARIIHPIRDGETVTVTTRLTGFRRVMARRESEVLDAAGRLLALVLVDWAMTDGRVPVRIPADFERVPVDGPGSFDPLRLDIPATPAGAASMRFVPRLRDLDPMDHANNGVYADWLDEVVATAGPDGEAAVSATPRTYRLEYRRPADRAAPLVASAWRDGPGWAHRLTDGAGTDLLRGRLDPGVPAAARPAG